MPSSASASPPAAATGRPSKWTPSGSRKLARLYLYTTLPIKKIVELLQADPSKAPGKDSANKNLNSLLDKEPRWLHPRTRSEMERRIDGLTKSSSRASRVRSRDTAQTSSTGGNNSSANNNDPRFMNGTSRANTTELRSEPSHSSGPYPSQVSTDGAHVAFAVGGPAPEMDAYRQAHGEHNRQQQQYLNFDDEPLAPPRAPFAVQGHMGHAGGGIGLLHRTTVMTSSTDMTVSSLQQYLSNYSVKYLRHVKRVMKRFTISNLGSDVSDDGVGGLSAGSSTSLGLSLDDLRPEAVAFPLPGDFLAADRHRANAVDQDDDYMDKESHDDVLCMEGPDAHADRLCYCAAVEADPAAFWTTPFGLTPQAEALLLGPDATTPAAAGVPSVFPLSQAALSFADRFGNTLLHLLAARCGAHMPDQLYSALQNGADANARNTAGQTFVHVLADDWFTLPLPMDVAMAGSSANSVAPQTLPVESLLDFLRRARPDFDPYATDVYGRSLFHVLEAKAAPHPHVLSRVLADYESARYGRRDAFGVVPAGLEPRVWVPPAMDGGMADEDAAQPLSATTTASEGTKALDEARFRRHARVLEHIRHALAEPVLEFAPATTTTPGACRGNGLHSLAAVILSEETLRGAATTANGGANGGGAGAAATANDATNGMADTGFSVRRSLKRKRGAVPSHPSIDLGGANPEAFFLASAAAAAAATAVALPETANLTTTSLPPVSNNSGPGPITGGGGAYLLDSSADRLQLRRTTLHTLLSAGVDPNAYDAEGETPLTRFARSLPEDDDYKIPGYIIADLVKGGAEVDRRNRRGETALMVAVRAGKKLLVRALVESGGARVNVRVNGPVSSGGAGNVTIAVPQQQAGMDGSERHHAGGADDCPAHRAPPHHTHPQHRGAKRGPLEVAEEGVVRLASRLSRGGGGGGGGFSTRDEAPDMLGAALGLVSRQPPARGELEREYAHLEACKAWLAGRGGGAKPMGGGVVGEWGKEA